jgi:hypothetical protein
VLRRSSEEKEDNACLGFAERRFRAVGRTPRRLRSEQLRERQAKCPEPAGAEPFTARQTITQQGWLTVKRKHRILAGGPISLQV